VIEVKTILIFKNVASAAQRSEEKSTGRENERNEVEQSDTSGV